MSNTTQTNQKERLKKIVVYVLLGFVFIGIIIFLLRPYFVRSNADQETGINTELPEARIDGLPANKVDAYETKRAVEVADEEELKEEKLETLYDYFSEVNNNASIHKENDIDSNSDDKSIEEAIRAYEASSQAKEEYYYTYVDPVNQQLYEAQEEMARQEEEKKRLHAELEQYKSAMENEKRQFELLEKSYQLATQYTKPTPQKATEPVKKEGDQNLDVISVVPQQQRLVSTLHQTEQDTILLRRMIEEGHNVGFLTSVGMQKDRSVPSNTIKAVVSETQTISTGDNIALQLLETIRLANGLVVPKNTKLVARAQLSGNRMKLVVQSIVIKSTLAGVNLSAYDTEGQEGIFVPNAPVSDAVREFTGGVTQTLSSGRGSYSFTTDPKGQMVSDLIRGAVQGAGNIVNNKVQEYKVTMKSGYRLYLLDRSNKQNF